MSSLIKNAELTWNEHGEPSAVHFEDSYFNSDNGLAETRYVFLENNRLIERWQTWQQPFFVIGETGFGSGLNFLATMALFEQWRNDNPNHCLTRLYFISFEKYPLTIDDLQSSHCRWPELSAYAAQLQQQYPPAIAGNHRLMFELSNQTSIVLDLWFGDIKDTLPSLHFSSRGLIDCWFLDGFAPSKNASMWNQTLYQNMAACSTHNATLATFTAAGEVRRGLITAGFAITKVKGFGRKREMITGQFNRTSNDSSQQSWYFRSEMQPTTPPTQVTIIGGGIASATLALALAQRHIDVTIICQDKQLAQGASGNRQGGFYPLLNANHDWLSQFYLQAFSMAIPQYQRLITDDSSLGQLCGVLQLGFDLTQKQRQQQLIEQQHFPTSLINQCDAAQASDIAGVTLPHSAIHFPQGGWISPHGMTHGLIEQAGQHANITLLESHQVVSLSSAKNHWQLALGDGSTHDATHVVMANGHHLSDFEQTKHLPLYATAGQVSHIEQSTLSSPLKTVLCYSGYMTPSLNNIHCIGASFDRNITSTALCPTAQQQNLEKLTRDIEGSPWTTSLVDAPLQGKLGVRMSVKDHLPLVGDVPDFEATSSLYSDLDKGKPSSKYAAAPHYPNLYLIGGLGSRGICSAPLLAQILSAQLTAEPQPVSQQLLNQLNPNRYWIKQLKRRKPLTGSPSN